jgi:hypothetical protein
VEAHNDLANKGRGLINAFNEIANYSPDNVIILKVILQQVFKILV